MATLQITEEDLKRFHRYGKMCIRDRYSAPYDAVILTGLVGLYEVCFEQAWKMMKEILEAHGFEQGATGSKNSL